MGVATRCFENVVYWAVEAEMDTITVTLPRERLVRLQEMATRLGVTLEELVSLSVEEVLTWSDQAFEDAVNRVLTKNKNLYQRLA